MSAATCHVCGERFAAHQGVVCQPQTSTPADEVTRLRTGLARLEAKHRRFAAETNRIITEQLAEIQRLQDRSTDDH